MSYHVIYHDMTFHIMQYDMSFHEKTSSGVDHQYAMDVKMGPNGACLIKMVISYNKYDLI